MMTMRRNAGADTGSPARDVGQARAKAAGGVIARDLEGKAGGRRQEATGTAFVLLGRYVKITAGYHQGRGGCVEKHVVDRHIGDWLIVRLMFTDKKVCVVRRDTEPSEVGSSEVVQMAGRIATLRVAAQFDYKEGSLHAALLKRAERLQWGVPAIQRALDAADKTVCASSEGRAV